MTPLLKKLEAAGYLKRYRKPEDERLLVVAITEEGLDEDLVWYGSMNFLSREHEDDILMRIRSEAIVKELLAISNQDHKAGTS